MKVGSSQVYRRQKRQYARRKVKWRGNATGEGGSREHAYSDFKHMRRQRTICIFIQ